MRLRVEARTGIDFLPLSEDGAYRFYEAALSLINGMEVLNYRAIKLPPEAIAVFR